jgi:hypothetical protein
MIVYGVVANAYVHLGANIALVEENGNQCY